MRFPRSIVPAVAAAALGLLAAGCGSDSPGASQAAATSSPSETPSPSETASPSVTPSPSVAPSTVSSAKTITVRVTGGKATPKIGRVEVAKGEQVRLVVTSDVADQVHVHGYDLELRLRPGKSGTLTFTADKTGLFEVETHETGLILFQLLVR